jgi:hypothetical protein
MPLPVFRPDETRDASVMHVVAVREPHEDPKLSRAAPVLKRSSVSGTAEIAASMRIEWNYLPLSEQLNESFTI